MNVNVREAGPAHGAPARRLPAGPCSANSARSGRGISVASAFQTIPRRYNRNRLQLGARIDHQVNVEPSPFRRENMKSSLNGAGLWSAAGHNAACLPAGPMTSAGVRRSSAAPVIAGGQESLSHVRDIEQARFFAGVQMFFQDAGSDTAPAFHSRQKARSCRPAPDAGRTTACGADFPVVSISSSQSKTAIPRPKDAQTRLSWEPESFPPSHSLQEEVGGVTPSVGTTAKARVSLSRSVITRSRSFCLRVSGWLLLRRPRHLPYEDRRLSPARDHVLARTHGAIPAGRPVAVHS